MKFHIVIFHLTPVLPCTAAMTQFPPAVHYSFICMHQSRISLFIVFIGVLLHTSKWNVSHLCPNGHALTSTHAQSHKQRTKCPLFLLMDNRSCGRRMALKTSRGCGAMKMSDQNQQAMFCNMFNQITVCVHCCECHCVSFCTRCVHTLLALYVC